MKFQLQIELDVPLDVACTHFLNRDNLLKWHPDLKKKKVLEGKPGEVGCKTLLDFGTFEIEETIIESRLPEQFLGDYLTRDICRNTMGNCFRENNGKTVYEVEVHYTEMNWFLRLMAMFMPWTLKGQVKKYLNKFKQTVEQ